MSRLWPKSSLTRSVPPPVHMCTVEIDWMLPRIAPTGRRVEVALVVVVHFRDGKLAHEHIYWDQASVLAQLGLIDPKGLPIGGADSARKVLDPRLPANALMRRSQ